MTPSPVDFRIDAPIARITLNRPEKRNALSPELISALHAALEESARDASVRVVLINARGKDFCSGADLAAFDQSGDAGVLDHMETARALANVFLEMRRHPRPIVAAVQGRALAGGCGLATACDLILATESAKFGYPEVNIGFVPAMVMAILRRNIGEKRAFELITSGEIISAETALACGMVNRVFADGKFTADVEEYVSNLAVKSASAVSLSKNLLYHIDSMPFEAAIEAGVHGNAIARSTQDARNGFASFLQARNSKK